MRAFLDPRSVVLIGVPRRVGIGAYNHLEMMLRYGYQGTIYPVHPEVSEIAGRKTYPTVFALPETPELAVISVRRDRVLSVFEDCAEKGIRQVLIVSQGFADADYQGKKLQRELVQMAQRYQVRVLGPNTMGVLNAFSGFSTAFIDIPRDPSPPPLSIVSQSGVFFVGSESLTGRVGKVIDIGNACDVGFVDFLSYLEEDPQTKIIVLHMEGVKKGRKFLRTVYRVARKKPVIVLKTARSTAGVQAALAHTGTQAALSQTGLLVREHTIFDQAFDEAGIICVRSMIELRAVCNAFLWFQPMKGPRVAAVTGTGACGVMAADACETYGLELAPLSENVREQLENPRIHWHHLRNPIDIWPLSMVAGSSTDVFKKAFRHLIQDDQVDAILGILQAMSSPFHADLDMVSVIRDTLKENFQHKPIALWLFGDGAAKEGAALSEDQDVVCFQSIDEALIGLSALWRYSQYLKRPVKENAFCKLFPVNFVRPFSPPSPGEILIGEKAFELLKHYNIPVVSCGVAHKVSSAQFFAKQEGFPIVLKILSPDWVHKSDWGGVRKNIKNNIELEAAYHDLEKCFHEHTPYGTLSGILVQKYIQGTEIFFGIKRDPRFGHVVVMGMGGIYAQIFKDISIALVPLDVSDAEAMIKSLRIYPLLKGIRGRSGVDLSAIMRILLALSQLAMDYPEIMELDLDPVFATTEGCRCADSRIVFC